MAHVLIAYRDTDLRDTLGEVLRGAGHTVTTVADGALAAAALWVARWPMVALLAGDLGQPDVVDILSCAADEADDGTEEPRLARHRYIVMTTSRVMRALANLPQSMNGLRASVLSIPVDLYDLLDAVNEAERHLSPWLERSVVAPLLPERVAALVHRQ